MTKGRTSKRQNVNRRAATALRAPAAGARRSAPDPVQIEVFKHLFHAIAEEMGAALRRTAFSPNIRERRDYSCAVFDCEGRVVAMGDHMPVHLGSMPMSVQSAIERLDLQPGDIAMVNDPFAGGTHLPDVTLVMPVFAAPRPRARTGAQGRARADFHVAARAHHADIGGAHAGSMGLATEIYQEGLRIPPVRLYRGGKLNRDVWNLLLANVRVPAEREGDLAAQIAACRTGERRLLAAVARYGAEVVHEYMGHLNDYAAALAQQVLAELLQSLPQSGTGATRVGDGGAVGGRMGGGAAAQTSEDGAGRGGEAIAGRTSANAADRVSRRGHGRPSATERQIVLSAEDFLDDDGISAGPVRIVAKLTAFRRRSGHCSLTVDFSGSDDMVAGCVNGVHAIAFSAVFYVLRCLAREDVPACSGIMRDVVVVTRLGSVVDAQPPAAVAAGNVELSQRLVDTTLRALAPALPNRIPAASSGTMNNVTLGGINPAGAALGKGTPFTYYETIAGGMGAHSRGEGASAIHTHMTNSLNTPVEVLELAYPVRVWRYAQRRGSGGAGGHRGGDGIIREIEALGDLEVNLLTDRRRFAPWGLAGGGDGACGRNTLLGADGTESALPGKTTLRLRRGQRLRIETPGGGGWGRQT
jgi:N-methylhydantoinase B